MFLMQRSVIFKTVFVPIIYMLRKTRVYKKYVPNLVKCYIQDNLCSSSIFRKYVLNLVKCYIQDNLFSSSI